MQIVILCGGKSTRLYPLSKKIPKAMVKIKKKPFLEHQIDLLKRDGIKEIVLCVGYKANQIKNYFRDGRKFEINIKYSSDGKKLLGTGGALKNAQNILENEFLVINGDTFLDINYQNLINFFHKKQKLGTVVVFKNQPKIMLNNIKINNKKKIINYNKREEEKANCVDAGIQVFKKEILNLIPQRKLVSLEEEIFPILIKKKELVAYPVKKKFYDIGTPKGLEKFKQKLEL